MKELSFSSWIKKLNEWADFGFTKPDDPKKTVDTDDRPTPSHHIEAIIRELRKTGMGLKEAKQDDFSTEVNWGEGPGALKAVISPFGGLRASLKKQTVDLNGHKAWATFKIINIEDNSNAENIAESIIKNLRMIDRENIPAPKSNCYNLETLAIHIAEGVNRFAKQKIMMYEAIRILRPQREYIIHYSVKGMGRQAEGQKRIDQIQIQVNFNEFTGMIRVCVNEIGDDIGKHNWRIFPSEFKEDFTPTQDPKTVVNCVVAAITALYR